MPTPAAGLARYREGMASNRDPAGKPPPDNAYIGTWLQSLPMPEVREGGESTWDLWHEAVCEFDVAFGPTVPSRPVPLSGDAQMAAPAPIRGPLSADALMVRARHNNRVCPRPNHWRRLHRDLGGRSLADLPPPPVDPWLWSKLSALQKRLFFREYLEWAERHHRLTELAAFMDGLHEEDWLHMGEG